MFEDLKPVAASTVSLRKLNGTLKNGVQLKANDFNTASMQVTMAFEKLKMSFHGERQSDPYGQRLFFVLFVLPTKPEEKSAITDYAVDSAYAPLDSTTFEPGINFIDYSLDFKFVVPKNFFRGYLGLAIYALHDEFEDDPYMLPITDWHIPVRGDGHE